MKILLTTDWYKPTINGVVTSVDNLCSGLTALGHEVRIATLSGLVHSMREGNVSYYGWSAWASFTRRRDFRSRGIKR